MGWISSCCWAMACFYNSPHYFPSMFYDILANRCPTVPAGSNITDNYGVTTTYPTAEKINS